MENIRVSEMFYSLQGEGVNAGVPSVFLRLGGCNLLCGGRGTQFDKQLHDGATWRCDTIETWMKAERMSVPDLFKRIEEVGYLAYMNAGARLVVTGGEPLMQQEAVCQLMRLIIAGAETFIGAELETNGTIVPTEDSLVMFDQFNVSPKLSTSGMDVAQRIKPAALEKFLQYEKAFFKFVISKAADLEEVYDTFIMPFSIPRERVWLMPAGSSQEELQQTQLETANACKMLGYRYSPRLQVNIWNKVVGV